MRIWRFQSLEAQRLVEYFLVSIFQNYLSIEEGVPKYFGLHCISDTLPASSFCHSLRCGLTFFKGEGKQGLPIAVFIVKQFSSPTGTLLWELRAERTRLAPLRLVAV